MDKNPAKEIRKKITANWIVVKLCENVVLGGEGGGGGEDGDGRGEGYPRRSVVLTLSRHC